MIYTLWEAFQQGQLDAAAPAPGARDQDGWASERARLETRARGLALICGALFELIRERTSVTEQDIEAKLREFEARSNEPAAAGAHESRARPARARRHRPASRLR